MDEKVDLDEIEKKSYKQLNEDGLLEIALGFVLILYSGLWYSGVIGVTVVFQLLLLPRLLEAVRERHTYPRIGYVKHFDETSKTGIGIIGYVIASMLVVAILILIVYGKITGDLIYQWIPTFLGLTLLGAMLYLNGKSGDNVYLYYAGYSVLSGFGFSQLKFQPVRNCIQYYLLFIGFSMLVAGIARFIQFRKKYPVFEEVLVNE
jgi:hypothetical protein